MQPAQRAAAPPVTYSTCCYTLRQACRYHTIACALYIIVMAAVIACLAHPEISDNIKIILGSSIGGLHILAAIGLKYRHPMEGNFRKFFDKLYRWGPFQCGRVDSREEFFQTPGLWLAKVVRSDGTYYWLYKMYSKVGQFAAAQPVEYCIEFVEGSNNNSLITRVYKYEGGRANLFEDGRLSRKTIDTNRLTGKAEEHDQTFILIDNINAGCDSGRSDDGILRFNGWERRVNPRF